MLGRLRLFQAATTANSASRYRPSAFARTWDRMIYPAILCCRYKVAWKPIR